MSFVPSCVIGNFKDLLSSDEKRGGLERPQWMSPRDVEEKALQSPYFIILRRAIPSVFTRQSNSMNLISLSHPLESMTLSSTSLATNHLDSKTCGYMSQT